MVFCISGNNLNVEMFAGYPISAVLVEIMYFQVKLVRLKVICPVPVQPKIKPVVGALLVTVPGQNLAVSIEEFRHIRQGRTSSEPYPPCHQELGQHLCLPNQLNKVRRVAVFRLCSVAAVDN